MHTIETQSFVLKAAQYLIPLYKRTHIMGVINVTPDSFSHDGLLKNTVSLDNLVYKAKKMVDEGADIIDIGGESSRPGSTMVSINEEIARVIPAVKACVRELNVPISVDTYKPEVARQALSAGAAIINNIHGCHLDESLMSTVAEHQAGIVLMHMQGQPETMQQKPTYRNVIEDISASLESAIQRCLSNGISDEQIIIDPGIGFGKTLAHNLQILNELEKFQLLNKPILIGTSRKSFIGKVLNNEVDERINGTIATMVSSILKGAHIIRVHDIKQAKEAACMIDAIIHTKPA